MIVRDYVACEVCGHNHTVRIGVGGEKYQPHKFPCTECGENISIALEIGNGLIFKDNAAQGDGEGSIINLDSFLLPNPKYVGVDHVGQRVSQARDYLIAHKAHYEAKYGKGSFEQSLLAQPKTQNVSLAEEWKLLKKCWSLHHRGKEKLSKKIVDNVNSTFYEEFEPLCNFYDWLFRFSSRLSGVVYDQHFEVAINHIVTLCKDNPELGKITDQLRKGLLEEHLQIYFNVFKQYFETDADFNQVYIYCSVGIKIPEGHQATSQNFDSTGAFYGNSFEAFTSLVEILACVNNVIAGRNFDQFETIDLKQYKKLDKASRCNPFAMNLPFSNLCKDVDNQLRNGSHHGGFRFNQENGVIKYRAGKGGMGTEQEITYTDYILKCTNLFLAIVTLLRIELVMHEHM